jgi:hypothetical protein
LQHCAMRIRFKLVLTFTEVTIRKHEKPGLTHVQPWIFSHEICKNSILRQDSALVFLTYRIHSFCVS